MKTDKIFYTLFQVFPKPLFQLIGESPSLVENYEFKSSEIKELAFRLDGVFLPKENVPDYPIYFVAVQFQKDEDFYWRSITEIFLFKNYWSLKEFKGYTYGTAIPHSERFYAVPAITLIIKNCKVLLV